MESIMKSMITELYAQSRENHRREITQKMLSVSLPLEDASLIKAISERFGQSVSTFCSEILQSSIREALMHLTVDDRERIAYEADGFTSEHQEKQGISESHDCGDVTVLGSFYWRQICDVDSPERTAAHIREQIANEGNEQK